MSQRIVLLRQSRAEAQPFVFSTATTNSASCRSNTQGIDNLRPRSDQRSTEAMRQRKYTPRQSTPKSANVRCPLFPGKRTYRDATAMSVLCPIPDSARCEHDRARHYRVAASLMCEKRRDPSWAGPVERDVFARICRPLKLVAERMDGTDRRRAPGHELPRSGLGARRVH